MKLLLIYFSVLAGCLGLSVVVSQRVMARPCWCWSHDHLMVVKQKPRGEDNQYVSFGSYGSEADWNNPVHILQLDYDQTQGKRIFYQQCVWCHADTTPAGPSNRSNVTPEPPLLNDGAVLNGENDDSLRKIISLGGSAVGKSAMMPPYGMSLTEDDINDTIAYMRVIAVPEYHRPPQKIGWNWKGKP